MERTLEFIQKYEFINLGAEVTRLLREQYALTKSNATKHAGYSRMHQQFEEKRRLEILATSHYEQLVHYYIERRTPNVEIHQKAVVFFEELFPLIPKAGTARFCYHSYQVGMIKHFAANDCQQALQFCEAGIKDLFKRKNSNREAKAGLLAQKMFCLIQLKVFDSTMVEDTMNTYWAFALEGSFNWFRGHELQLFYCLHTQQYDKALASFTQGYQHPRFEAIQGTVRENWHVYGGYLHLLADLGQLDKKAVEQVAGPFRYSKFINDIAILGREKGGMNIPLVNLPLLISLAKSESDFPEEYLSSLERYHKRYLKDELNARSACFVKLLLLLSRKPFEGKNVDKKIRQELQVLRQEKPQLSRQTIAVEIIPYEDLWWLLTGEKV